MAISEDSGFSRGEPEVRRRVVARESLYCTMPHDAERVVRGAVRAALRSSDAPLLLAVSGGLDSMVLLEAMAELALGRIAAVATFDHRTGAVATASALHVAQECAARGLPIVHGVMPESPRAPGLMSEAALRDARHAFLRRHAASLGARIATAHHADDQIETVLMRVLRGSGARGLAGLRAPSDIVRPLLAVSRETIAAYAARRGVRWCADPSNESRVFLRNRVRHDLLPALTKVDPSLPTALARIGCRAAAWREELDSCVDGMIASHPGGLAIAVRELAGLDTGSLTMVWGAISGRAGLALDRRGAARLAAFTLRRPRRGTIPLSGGWCMEAGAGVYLLRKSSPPIEGVTDLPARGTLDWGGFRFREVPGDVSVTPWMAPVPAGSLVRVWAPGDRLAGGGLQPARRVKRWLSDAGVHGEDRRGWPVVVAGEDVVWIPGVRRSDAATERSGRPVRHYVCERIHG